MNIIKIIIIVFLFYSNIVVLNKLYRTQQEKDILYNELENSYINNDEALSVLNKQVKTLNNYCSFKPYLVDDSVLFENFLFIYRYTSSVCESCVNRDFDVLKSFADKFGKEHVLVVSSIINNRENRIKLDVELKGIRYMIVPDSIWEIPIDKNTGVPLPFFAVVNELRNIEFVIFSDMHTLVKYFIDDFESPNK